MFIVNYIAHTKTESDDTKLDLVQPEDVQFFLNFNLQDIVTPVDVNAFERLLIASGYNAQKTSYLINGFKNGFSLQYTGNLNGKRMAANLKLRVGSKLELWNKVMIEVKANRYAGPFTEISFENCIQSPIGLVPKDKGRKTRLIFHLSYPRKGDSVNSGIDKNLCSVIYPDFEEAVNLCLKAGRNCKIAKSDMSMAFRNIPMDSQSWKVLVLKAFHPISGKLYYFVDKCLPFGASISCAIFQDFSNAVAHLVKFETKENLVNYLDDYLFAALLKTFCDGQVQVFLNICREIRFPVALEKMFWGTKMLVFLGLLLDTENQVICIPLDKLDKALDMVEFFLNKKNKKVTVLQVQRLCGYLNFLARAVIPGRTFIRRLYSMAPSQLKQHHHMRVKQEHRMDLEIWRNFLNFPSIFCRPFMDSTSFSTAEDIDMYSDASGNFRSGGAGAYCGRNWAFVKWNTMFMCRHKPSIEYMECLE